MAPCKPKPKVTPKVPFNPPKVSKRKTKNADKVPKSCSERIQGEPEPHRLELYRNGLLNLEKTPAHLQTVVKRNATESPLLQLPSEIRNSIWQFTLTHKLVRLPDYRGKGGAIQYTQDRNVDLKLIGSNHFRKCSTVASGFRLPEVCRQIYSETSLVAYGQSTFELRIRDMFNCTGLKRLMPVQTREITSIEMSPETMCRRYIWCAISEFRESIRDGYCPNLRRIIIGRLALEILEAEKYDSEYRALPTDKKAWLVDIIKHKEGSDIEVEFKEDDPSWWISTRHLRLQPGKHHLST